MSLAQLNPSLIIKINVLDAKMNYENLDQQSASNDFLLGCDWD